MTLELEYHLPLKLGSPQARHQLSPPSLYVFIFLYLGYHSWFLTVSLGQLELCFLESPSLHGSYIGIATGKCIRDLEGTCSSIHCFVRACLGS